jgi:hypothetical protein
MASKPSQAAKTATLALQILWREGFFKTSRLKADVDGHLAKRGNHFSGPELGMALSRAKHLTRKGKQGSYEYIQKYPYVGGGDEPSPSKKAKRK